MSRCATLAGDKACCMYLLVLSFHSIISIFSPPSSFIIVWILDPRCPTQDPTGSIPSSLELTATFVLDPASLAIDFISTVFENISGTSNSNNFSIMSGLVLDKIKLASFESLSIFTI